MSDSLIRRSDAIEAIENTDWYHQNKNKDMVSGANSAEHQAWYKAEDIYKALEAVPTADRPSGYIHIDDVYRLVAGHSDYHGDSILSALTCLTEGKDVKPIRPLDRPQDENLSDIPTGSDELQTEKCDRPQMDCENCWKQLHCRAKDEPKTEVTTDCRQTERSE